MKRHLVILLALTILVRGFMVITYPLAGHDDNVSAQRYLIEEVTAGNLLIGNVRYQTGYPLFIAPVVALADAAGRLSDRVVLLVQVALYSTIPFLLYDMVRRRRGPREGLAVGLVALLDPFAWQIPHAWLPEWLVMTLLVAGLWLLSRAPGARRGPVWAAAAGVVLGCAALARLNVLPMVAVLGATLFLTRDVGLRRRAVLFVAVGAGSGAVMLAYMLLVQLPSTGSLQFSCMFGMSMMNGTLDKGVPVGAANGPASARLADLATLPPLREVPFSSVAYPLWRVPGPWVPDEERAAFLAQPYGMRPESIGFSFSAPLVYYLGPCPYDALVRDAAVESVRAHPGPWLEGAARTFLRLLVYDTGRGDQLLPRAFSAVSGQEPGPLGFVRTSDPKYYTGQVVWEQGVVAYSAVFQLWHAWRLLFPLALVWAWLSGDWAYRAGALLLIAYAALLTAIHAPEMRTFSALYPLTSLLMGGLAHALWRRLARRGPAPG